MTEIISIVLYSWIAGITAFIGAVIAGVERLHESTLKTELIRGIIAFGGGILTAAVAFALVPHGIDTLSAWTLSLLFGAGGLAFCLLDIKLTHAAGSKAQFTAMLSDFVPEALALGAVFAHNHRLGALLAVFIAAQNFPEGFNAFRELKNNGGKPSHILGQMFMVSFLGPCAGLLGYFFLQKLPSITAGIMVFAGGGILYLVFQDIAPQAQMRKHWLPPLGAVLGFIIGILGKMLIG